MRPPPSSRVLLLISAILSSSTPSTIASSFVLSPTAMIGSKGASQSFVGKNHYKKNNRYYDPLFLAGGGAAVADSQDGSEGGGVSPPPQQAATSTSSMSSSETTSDAIDSSTTTSSSSSTPSSSSSFLGPKAHVPPGFLRSRIPNFPWYRVPNSLTYIRCLAIPIFVGLFYLPASAGRSNLYTGSIFAIASITDWLDGYLARRWDISTPFGAFLDPVADKLMVSTSLILLSGRYGPIVAIPTLIILAREIAVSALREWMAQRGERNVVKVGIQGKIKTALTMFALTVLLFVPSSSSTSAILFKLGIPLLYLSTLVTVTSGSVYFIAAAPALFGSKK
mmetsp:Transcript_24877/g.25229  ORF Transcript_24877/g.25229 Transcript_24877/m.25229 type:complete len:336 (-) Transcript_24877:1522-2529(-)